MTRRRVNGRFLLILVAVAAVSGVGIYFTHRAMVYRNSAEIRSRAVAAAKAEDVSKAIELYAQYRKLRPDDLEATIALANLLQRKSDSFETWQRVFNLLEGVLRQDPSREQVRRTLVDAALKLRRYADADFHLNHLLAQAESGEGNAELFRLKAEVQVGLREFAQAGAFYIKAIETDPSQVKPYAQLARVLRENPESIRSLMTQTRLGRPTDGTTLADVIPDVRPGAQAADVGPAIMNTMVRQARPSWNALIERARYWQSTGNIAAAVEDARAALEHSPAHASAATVLSAAQIELAAAGAAGQNETGSFESHRQAAERIAQAGIDAGLEEPRLYLVLTKALILAGRGQEPVSRQGESRQQTLGNAIALMETAVARAKELRLAASSEEALQLRETEIELRWYLANYRIDAAAKVFGEDDQVVKQTRTTMELLTKMGCRRELVDFLGVRLEMVGGAWAEAADELELLRHRVMDMPGVRRRIDGMLAAAYRHLENPAERIAVFRRAIADDPLWLAARLGLASALAEAGQTNEALQKYARLLDVPGVPRRMARLLTLSAPRNGADTGNAADLQKLIEKIAAAHADDPAAALLGVDLLISQGDVAAAAVKLAALGERFPNSREVWTARFRFASSRRDQSLAARIKQSRQLVATGQKRFGDCPAVRIARANLSRIADDGKVSQTIEKLSQTDETYSPAEKVELLKGLADVAARAGDTGTRRMLWEKIAELKPEALLPRLRIAEFAVDARDRAGVEEALSQIRQIEGEQGPNGDFIAAYEQIVLAADNAELRSDSQRLAAFLAEPRELLARAAEHRGYWAEIPRAQGLLELIAGNDEAAADFFERAWRLGDRSRLVATTLIQYYQSTNQFAAAEQIIHDLESRPGGAVASGLGDLAWRLQLEQGNIDRALKITARRAEKTGDFDAQKTYANILLLKYRSLSKENRNSESGASLLAQTQQAFANVVKSHPQEPDGWLSFVTFLQRTGQTKEAHQAIAEAKAALAKRPEPVRLVALARCHAVLGEEEQATALFGQAVTSDATNVRTRMIAADYMSRVGRLKEARKHVDWILDPANAAPPEAVNWARRRSAFILAASRGRHEDVMRAIELLRGGAASGEASVDDLRAQVALLAGLGTAKDRQLMLAILEKIAEKSKLSPRERFQMAALYETTDQWTKAESLLEELLAEDSSNPRYLAAYVVGAARYEPQAALSAAELRPYLERLEAAAPHSLQTALARAEFEKRFGSIQQAGAVLTSYAAALEQETSRAGDAISDAERTDLRSAAEAARELGAGESALALYQRLAEVSSDPEDVLPLATYLARQGRYDRALDLLKSKASKLSPAAIAVTAVNIVSLGTPSPADVTRAEALVTSARQQSPDSIRIRTTLGGLLAVQGKYDQAEAIYRDILEQQPQNAAVLNNLAWLLMVANGDTAEASRLINEAIAVAGPVTSLVDTRAAIDLARGHVDEAVADLREAFASNPNANIGFHLAIALSRLGQAEEAREIFAKAREMGLDINRLHPSEHAAYQELTAQFSES